MIKSKQRMDFNMTSNNQKYTPKKRTRSLLKPQNPSLPRLRGLLRQRSRRPVFYKIHRRRAYLDDFRKTQNGNYQYEGSRYACELSEKRVEKEIHRDGGSRNRSPPADDRRRMCTVGGTAGKHFSCCFHMQCSWRRPAASRGHVQGFWARNIRFGNTFISRQCAKFRCAAESASRRPECPS